VKRALVVFFVLAALSAATAQEPARPSFSLSVDARTWATVNLGMEYPLIDDQLKAALTVSVPVLMYVQGAGLDTIQVGLGLVSDWRPVAACAAGLRSSALLTGTYHSQALGDFFGIGTNVLVNPFWDFGTIDVGPIASWQRVWITHITLSADSRATFQGSASEFEPADGWYAWGASELRLGGALRLATPDAGVWSLGLGPRLAPGSMVAPLEGFPMGEWPFWLQVGWEQRF